MALRLLKSCVCVRIGFGDDENHPLCEDRPIKQLVADNDDDGEDDNGIVLESPSHFFKLALDPERMEAIAFILSNATHCCPNKAIERPCNRLFW